MTSDIAETSVKVTFLIKMVWKLKLRFCRLGTQALSVEDDPFDIGWIVFFQAFQGAVTTWKLSWSQLSPCDYRHEEFIFMRLNNSVFQQQNQFKDNIAIMRIIVTQGSSGQFSESLKFTVPKLDINSCSIIPIPCYWKQWIANRFLNMSS